MIAMTSVMFLWRPKPDSSMNGRSMKDIEDNVIAANIAADDKEIKELKNKLKKIGELINRQKCLFESKKRHKLPCESKVPICQSCILKDAYKRILKNG